MSGRRGRWVADVVLTAAVAFLVALSAGRIAVWLEWLVEWPGRGAGWWVAVVAAGAVLSIGIVAMARTTAATTDALADGVIRGRLDVAPAPARFAGLLAGVGTGTPLGHDSPLAYAGGALGVAVARRLRRPERWCMLAAGAAALSMVIGAPIAAALFVSEIGRRGLPRRTDSVPLALGGAAGWAALRLTGERGGVMGADPGFGAGQVVVGALAIGGSAALVGRALCAVLRRADLRAMRPAVRMAIAGVSIGVVGAVAWVWSGAPILLGSGERLQAWATAASQPGLLLATTAFAALVVVASAAGVVGGLFLPLLAIGSMLGVLVGRAWLPDVPYAACAGLGALALVAAAHGTALAATAMAFATFGWSSTAWLAVAAVVIAREGAGARTVSTHQLPASLVAPRRRRRAVVRT